MPEANKRLAQMGDGLFKHILGVQYYKLGASKGDISQTLQRIASNKNLDRVGRMNGLDKFIVLQNGKS